MDFADLVVATQDRTGVTASDPMLTGAVLKRLVNAANAYIATVHDWPWQQVMPVTFATAAGTQDYAPPGDWLRTVDLRVTSPSFNTDGMTLYSAMELDDRWSSVQRGQPTEYAIYGDHLRLAPCPDGIYTVSHRYVQVEPAMSGDTDTPIMPDQFRTSIVEYAAYLALRRTSEEQRAAVAMTAFQGWIAIMLQDRKRSTAPQRIRVRPGNIV